MSIASKFDYSEAFSRNIGWVSSEELQRLRGARVAIAGLGGVGGSHLLTLARLGVGKFNIADFDTFELPNFNRQAGATISSLGRQKTEVLAQLAKDINPELDIKTFAEGINEDNVSSFLDDVDIYVDSLDFFCFAERMMVFDACYKRGIPATTAAPLGMGVAMLNFLPGKMTFEEYFRLKESPPEDRAARFLFGVAPARLHFSYLDFGSLDLANNRGPSTVIGCQLCAGVAAAQTLKILLKRGKILAAPHGLHFDAYLNTFIHTWLPWGNKNPLQRIILKMAALKLSQRSKR